MIMIAATTGELIFLAGCVISAVFLSVMIGVIIRKAYRDWKNEKED